MRALSSDREEFCAQCMRVFESKYELEKKESWLKKIVEELRKFQEDIDDEDAVLKWYTKNSFVYRILNESLRTDDVGMLFHSRYVIRELNEQLIKRQCNDPVLVYRGQRMSHVEAELLGKSIGQRVSMKSFLSTSRDRRIAEIFADAGAQSDAKEVAFVIFIINANPDENNTRLRPFADITKTSVFEEAENEILFMLGTVFRITNVAQDMNRRWIVSMTACNQEDMELNQLFSWFKDGHSISGTDDETFHSVGMLLLGMGMPYETDRLYRHMLSEYKLFPPDDVELARCYHMLGKAALVAGLAESANSWWEQPPNCQQVNDDERCKNEQIIDAQHENTKKQHQGTLNTIEDDGNSEIDGTENDGTGDKSDRKNNHNNIPDKKKSFDRNNDDDYEDRANRRDHMPDRKNNRNNRPDKTKPYNRNNYEDFDDSGELLPSKDRKRKHWKKDKHMQKHKHWKKKKHGKHHHGHEHHRKHHHHHHHRHHHEDKNHRHRKPNHRKPDYNEEDEFIDKNKSNKDQYNDLPASRRNPTNTDDYNSDRNINNRNNDDNIGE
ncbi:unnamed protein product [Adineta steineri]|uniref:NAD(P)(+)--arginine ADP-ribosyltransferase n=1 Tax=Adineta steineri TaxID=433720 RepID=A0A815CPR7_9BILA|nr:unnamed protein product [Adineta steineri]CAF1287228.1 unnamed protein product [Adineta steineri]